MINKDDLTAALRQRAFNARRRHELPYIAIGDKPVPFYTRPFTIGDTHKYGTRLDQGDVKAIVELFVEKAEDESGNKLFGKDMVQVFMDTLESDELASLGDTLTSRRMPEAIEDAEGKSEGIPSDS